MYRGAAASDLIQNGSTPEHCLPLFIIPFPIVVLKHRAPTFTFVNVSACPIQSFQFPWPFPAIPSNVLRCYDVTRQCLDIEQQHTRFQSCVAQSNAKQSRWPLAVKNRQTDADDSQNFLKMNFPLQRVCACAKPQQFHHAAVATQADRLTKKNAIQRKCRNGAPRTYDGDDVAK